MASQKEQKRPLEVWVRIAFGLGLFALLDFVLLGFESPAAWHRQLYLVGPVLLGLCGASLLAVGLALSIRKRPFIRRGRLPAFFLAGICLLIGGCPMPYPSPYAERVSGIAFGFPLEGEWRVRFGAEEPFWNPLVLQPDRRFGFEFWRTDPRGNPDREATVGSRVVSPAAGKLIGIFGAHELDPSETWEKPSALAEIVLGLADDTYLFLGGLALDTLEVTVGDQVTAGQGLGFIGQALGQNVPASLEIHLQDSPRPGDGVGMPLCFDSLRVEGELRSRVVPAGGLRRGASGWGWLVSRGGPLSDS